MANYDAIIVGAGPNGLAAAIRLAQAGCSVLVVEAKATIGGGTRTLPLTLPGFQHDVCSAIHPLGLSSPYLSSLPLADYGLEWVQPAASAAHPLDHGDGIIVWQDVERTAESLGRDAVMYRRLLSVLTEQVPALLQDFLGPLRIPKHPLPFALFGALAIWPASLFAKTMFREERTRAMFAGMAAHSLQPLEAPATAAFGLILLLLAHAVGWPMAKGGSQAISDAMAAYLKTLGGEIKTDYPVTQLKDLPPARKVLLNLTPRQIVSIAGDALPASYRWRLGRYQYGSGVFKLDYALSEPIPWQNPQISEAATVHIGSTLAEIARSERLCAENIHPDKPYVLLAQQTLFDSTRAPDGQHTAWAYCHVPHGSDRDMTTAIENQIERYAPGFRDVILERHAYSAVDMQRYNANYIGGDINGGAQTLTQLFTRPVTSLSPYATPNPDFFICSSATPPGGGVHGMCGFHAAEAVLRSL